MKSQKRVRVSHRRCVFSPHTHGKAWKQNLSSAKSLRSNTAPRNTYAELSAEIFAIFLAKTVHKKQKRQLQDAERAEKALLRAEKKAMKAKRLVEVSIIADAEKEAKRLAQEEKKKEKEEKKKAELAAQAQEDTQRTKRVNQQTEPKRKVKKEKKEEQPTSSAPKTEKKSKKEKKERQQTEEVHVKVIEPTQTPKNTPVDTPAEAPATPAEEASPRRSGRKRKSESGAESPEHKTEKTDQPSKYDLEHAAVIDAAIPAKIEEVDIAQNDKKKSDKKNKKETKAAEVVEEPVKTVEVPVVEASPAPAVEAEPVKEETQKKSRRQKKNSTRKSESQPEPVEEPIIQKVEVSAVTAENTEKSGAEPTGKHHRKGKKHGKTSESLDEITDAQAADEGISAPISEKKRHKKHSEGKSESNTEEPKSVESAVPEPSTVDNVMLEQSGESEAPVLEEIKVLDADLDHAQELIDHDEGQDANENWEVPSTEKKRQRRSEHKSESHPEAPSPAEEPLPETFVEETFVGESTSQPDEAWVEPPKEDHRKSKRRSGSKKFSESASDVPRQPSVEIPPVLESAITEHVTIEHAQSKKQSRKDKKKSQTNSESISDETTVVPEPSEPVELTQKMDVEPEKIEVSATVSKAELEGSNKKSSRRGKKNKGRHSESSVSEVTPAADEPKAAAPTFDIWEEFASGKPVFKDEEAEEVVEKKTVNGSSEAPPVEIEEEVCQKKEFVLNQESKVNEVPVAKEETKPAKTVAKVPVAPAKKEKKSRRQRKKEHTSQDSSSSPEPSHTPTPQITEEVIIPSEPVAEPQEVVIPVSDKTTQKKKQTPEDHPSTFVSAENEEPKGQTTLNEDFEIIEHSYPIDDAKEHTTVAKKGENEIEHGKKEKKSRRGKKKSHSSETGQTEITEEIIAEMSSEVKGINGTSHVSPIQVNEVTSTAAEQEGQRVLQETIKTSVEVDSSSANPTQFAQNVQKLVESTLKDKDINVNDPNVKVNVQATLVKLTEKENKPKVVYEHKPITLAFERQKTVAESEKKFERPTRERVYKLLNKDIIYCSAMIDQYGEDYEGMSKDPKNVYRDSARMIQRKMRIFRESPHFATYQKAKELGKDVAEILEPETA